MEISLFERINWSKWIVHNGSIFAHGPFLGLFIAISNESLT